MRRLATVLSFVFAPVLAAQCTAPDAITHTWTLGGNGGWDYHVPSATSHRVYIGRAARVMVVDTRTGKLVCQVTGSRGAHGAAITACPVGARSQRRPAGRPGGADAHHDYSARKAYRLLAAVYETQVASMLLEERVYDHQIYLGRLMALPTPPTCHSTTSPRAGRPNERCRSRAIL